MSKKIFYLITAIFLLLVSHRIASPVAAGNTIIFGPVELEENSGGSNQTTLEIIVQTQNPERTYTLNSKDNGGCPARLKSGPCIGQATLEADPAGNNTHIEIIKAIRIFNGTPDNTARVFLQSPTQAVWDLRPGGQTGWITYKWEKLIGTPGLQITPTKITKDEKVAVQVILPQPLAQIYEINITSYQGTQSIAYVNVLCVPEKGTCNTKETGVENFNHSPGATQFTFELSGNHPRLMENYTYVVSITSPSIPKDVSDKIKQTFEVVGPTQSTLKLEVDPNTINSSAIKNATIQVKLVNASTNEPYEIKLSNSPWSTTFTTCSGPGCIYPLKLSDALQAGSYTITVTDLKNASFQGTAQLTVVADQAPPAPGTIITQPGSGQQNPTSGTSAKGTLASGAGQSCDTQDNRGPAIKTAIGCIHTNPAELVKDLMTFVIGIGGGLAFLMMLLGAFQMLTSAGNPETLNAGRERLTSAVIGLLLVIFALLLLQIIGVDILKIPGFGRS